LGHVDAAYRLRQKIGIGSNSAVLYLLP